MISTYLTGLLAETGISIVGALGVYIILSTGQLSLGNAAFMAIGAYSSSVLTVWYGVEVTLAVLIGAVVAGLVGFFVGFPALRLRGIYLAMATLGLGEMTRSLLLNVEATGGAAGFFGMPSIGIAYIWAWVALLFGAIAFVERSRLWLCLRSINDDEIAAGLVGMNATALKVAAFSAGAAVAGVAGGLLAHYRLYIEPGNFGFEQSVEMVLAVILGGSTLAIGAVVGAFLMVMLPEALRFVSDWRLAAFGALLILVLLVRRQGILDRRAFAMLLRWREG
jgi:branched-chain amino acid transport system permease protein